eukprot:3196878-Pyramimonas_sp.AAC.1
MFTVCAQRREGRQPVGRAEAAREYRARGVRRRRRLPVGRPALRPRRARRPEHLPRVRVRGAQEQDAGAGDQPAAVFEQDGPHCGDGGGGGGRAGHLQRPHGQAGRVQKADERARHERGGQQGGAQGGSGGR